MPRVLKFTTSGMIDEIPDMSLAVIEHAFLFYMIEKRFSGKEKYLYYAVAGAGYEYFVASLKAQDPESQRKA